MARSAHVSLAEPEWLEVGNEGSFAFALVGDREAAVARRRS